MEIVLKHVDKFFSTARERYEIKLRRKMGDPWPWTDDPIFREWRFTNVHREDDKTTTWFREHIRDPLCKNLPDYYTPQLAHVKITEATLIFRWFNRIETGQIIEDLLLHGWNTVEARQRLYNVSPVVTGAYIIKAGDGVSKLDGILACIDEARPYLPRMVPGWGHTLHKAWEDLKTLHFMGGFMAYEVVTDLRWTPVLCNANDIMSWANFGPGAIRGMGRVVDNDPWIFKNTARDQRLMLDLAKQLLSLSQIEDYWPQVWPKWEMHEIEMWLCEYAKYCNGVEGQRLKRRYTPGG